MKLYKLVDHIDRYEVLDFGKNNDSILFSHGKPIAAIIKDKAYICGKPSFLSDADNFGIYEFFGGYVKSLYRDVFYVEPEEIENYLV